MTKENQKLREFAKARGVPLWRVAIALGVSEPTLIRWLRLPLSATMEQRIITVIQDLARGDENAETQQA